MNESLVKKKIDDCFPQKINHLLICASFEDRCLSMFEYLDPDKVGKAAVFYFSQFTETSSDHLETLKSHFNADVYGVDYNTPTTFADAVTALFSGSDLTDNYGSLVVDISTFTRESLLILLKFLILNQDKFEEIIIFYRFALVSDYLSDGVCSIRSVLGYMGDVSIDKPTHLIVLSGFEYERAKEIIDTLEPDHLSIGYGGKDNSISDVLHEKNVEFTDKLVAYYSGENIGVFEHSLRDPNEIKDSILVIAGNKPGYNTVVAPLNNKISTIGAALASVTDTSIQLIYSQMEEYNQPSYSQSTDDCLIFDFKKIYKI